MSTAKPNLFQCQADADSPGGLGFLHPVNGNVCLLNEEETSLEVFPGLNTAKERKKFAIFHTCTLALCPVVSAVIVYLIYNRWPFEEGGFRGIWIAGSLFLWNALGSWRFGDDSLKSDGFMQSRLVFFVLLIGFPFLYLYNLWHVLVENEGIK